MDAGERARVAADEGVASHESAHAAAHGEAAMGAADADPLYDNENPSRPCGKRHPTFRLAMLIPWVNELPPWLTYFITTAQRSAFLIDWLIFHETLTPPGHLPDNVRFIDLGAGGLSQLFGLKMGEELGMPVRNASLLIRSMRFMLEKWPRLVAEYKPAFGSIFEQYITDYSHWGYCDLDMVIGNLPLFLEHRELQMQVGSSSSRARSRARAPLVLRPTLRAAPLKCQTACPRRPGRRMTAPSLAVHRHRTSSPTRSATWTRSTSAASGRSTETSIRSRPSGRPARTWATTCRRSCS